jgi:two-component system phosphate regulon sensor histidine kinase PhoR
MTLGTIYSKEVNRSLFFRGVILPGLVTFFSTAFFLWLLYQNQVSFLQNLPGHPIPSPQEIEREMFIYSIIGFSFVAVTISLLFTLFKHSQEALRTDAETEALVLSIGEGFVAINGRGRITYANEEAEKLSGYSNYEMIGKNYEEILHIVDERGEDIMEKDRPFYKAIAEAKKTEIDTQSKLHMIKKDGTRFAVSAIISPVFSPLKTVEGIVVIFKDNTKESDVDKMKTEFLSLTSHQLLTPVTAIKLISEMLVTGFYGDFNNPEQKENIQSIQTLAERMGGLVRSQLNVARIEGGRIGVDPKPTNLKKLIDEVTVELKNRIEKKRQNLTVTVDENIPEINIDPQLIRDVYKNFLTNAVKYTPEGGNLSVDVEIKDGFVISKISDTGYGIPSSDIKRVFEKFYRGDNILKFEKDGNGLGLYTIKQLVEISGGNVWFESIENKGTIFWFSLPRSGSKPRQGDASFVASK